MNRSFGFFVAGFPGQLANQKKKIPELPETKTARNFRFRMRRLLRDDLNRIPNCFLVSGRGKNSNCGKMQGPSGELEKIILIGVI